MLIMRIYSALYLLYNYNTTYIQVKKETVEPAYETAAQRKFKNK